MKSALAAALALSLASCATPRREPSPPVVEVPSEAPTITPQPASEPPIAAPPDVAVPVVVPRAPGLVLRLWPTDQAPTKNTMLWPNQPAAVARVVPTLDLEFDVSHPDYAAAGRRWMGEVEGDLEVALAGRYGLRTSGSDALRVYIDDVFAFDAANACELELAAGPHHLLLTTFTDTGTQRITLEWRPPASASFEPIPATMWSHIDTALEPTMRGIKRSVERAGSVHAAPIPNPTLRLSEITLESLRAPVAALAWIDDRNALVATRNGNVWLVDSANNYAATRVASGLFEPRGVAIAGDRRFVLQASELTELIDNNGDGIADAQRCACAAWSVDRELGCVATRLRKDGETLRIVLEMRGAAPNSTPAAPLALRYSLTDGSATREAPGERDDEIDFAGGVSALSDGSTPSIDRGPYTGQLLSVAADSTTLQRCALDRVDGSLQGCTIALASGIDFDLVRAVRGPAGALFAPPARASKANANTAFMQRLELLDVACFDLLAVRAAAGGLELEFTQPLAADSGWEVENYVLSARALDAAETDTRALTVSAASVSEDRRVVSLAVELRVNDVVTVRVVGPLRSETGARLLNSTARYYVKRIPTTRELSLRASPEALSRQPLSAEQSREGWSELFDGKSLSGWHSSPAVSPSSWRVEAGVLVNAGGGADLVSDEYFENFELSFEWRVAAGAASAVRFHVDEDRFIELELAPSFELLDDAGRVEGRNPLRASGACRDLYAPRSAESAPVGVWNRARIVARDGHVEHWLDDVRIVEYTVGSDDWRRRAVLMQNGPVIDRRRGALALRASDRPVEFRALRIRALESRP